MPKPKSAYSQPTKFGKEDHHIIVVWVDNEAGVLARVVGLFSGRGYNIEALNVTVVDIKNNLSRITIETLGEEKVISHQIHFLVLVCYLKFSIFQKQMQQPFLLIVSDKLEILNFLFSFGFWWCRIMHIHRMGTLKSPNKNIP